MRRLHPFLPPKPRYAWLFCFLLTSILLPSWSRAENGGTEKKPDAAPPSERKPDERKPDESKPTEAPKPGLWDRMKKGMGDIVPQGVKDRWDGAQKRWEKTKAVLDAMRKLVGEDDEEKKKRVIKETREAIKNKWEKEDQAVEKSIQDRLRLDFWKEACAGGSSASCIAWKEAFPSDPEPARRLRDIWLRRQEWDKVLPFAETLAQSPAASFEDLFSYTKVLEQKKQTEKVASLYQRMLSLAPKNPILRVAVGEYALAKGEIRKAQEFCSDVTKENPADADAWLCLARAQHASKQPEALASFYQACKLSHPDGCRGALDLRPKGASGMLWWTTTISRMGGQGIARGTTEQSCRFGVKSACRSLALSYREKAAYLEKHEMPGQAAWFFQLSAQTAPEDAEAWRELGRFLLRRKEWSSACEALERSLRLHDQQSLLWRSLAECRLQQTQTLHLLSQKAYERACALGDYRACDKLPPPSR